MQNSRKTKLVLIATSFVLAFLHESIAGMALADEVNSTNGTFIQSGLSECADGDPLDHSSCGNGQHCVNCHTMLSSISIIINDSVKTIAFYEPVRRLQVDHQPQFKPPRIY